MMAWVQGGLAAAGSIGGSLLAGSSAASNTKRQVEFQKELSRTAYQRAAKDLEKAGLNRVLALGNPASTPSGASAPVPDYGAAFSSAATALASAKQAKAQLVATEEQAVNIAQDTQKKFQEKNESIVRQDLMKEQTRSAKAIADMDEVKKAGFSIVQPAVDAIIEKVHGIGNSAKSVLRPGKEKGEGFTNAVKDNSAKGVRFDQPVRSSDGKTWVKPGYEDNWRRKPDFE